MNTHIMGRVKFNESNQNDNICLYIRFKNMNSYNKAIKFIDDKSPYTIDIYNNEFMSAGFNCDSQEDADALESALTDLLDNENIDGYYFETE